MIIDPEIDDKELSPINAAKRIYRVLLNSSYLEDEISSAFPVITAEEKKRVKKEFLELKGKIFNLLR